MFYGTSIKTYQKRLIVIKLIAVFLKVYSAIESLIKCGLYKRYYIYFKHYLQIGGYSSFDKMLYCRIVSCQFYITALDIKMLYFCPFLHMYNILHSGNILIVFKITAYFKPHTYVFSQMCDGYSLLRVLTRTYNILLHILTC